MFKRGDIVELNLKRMDGLIEVGILRDADYLISAHDGKVQSTAGYEMTKPPIYEKDGQKFVPSGEFRIPRGDEFWLYAMGNIEGKGKVVGGDSSPTPYANPKREDGHRPILLPVPELEHEFKVGDWVGNHNGDVAQITDADEDRDTVKWDADVIKGGTSLITSCTPLPGRPLTTDDLMQVLSGKKIMVECHACGCGGNRGEVYFSEKCEGKGGGFFHENFTTYENEVVFRHDEDGRVGMPGWYFARFQDGTIVFAEGVEGNIYVVSA